MSCPSWLGDLGQTFIYCRSMCHPKRRSRVSPPDVSVRFSPLLVLLHLLLTSRFPPQMTGKLMQLVFLRVANVKSLYLLPVFFQTFFLITFSTDSIDSQWPSDLSGYPDLPVPMSKRSLTKTSLKWLQCADSTKYWRRCKVKFNLDVDSRSLNEV